MNKNMVRSYQYKNCALEIKAKIMELLYEQVELLAEKSKTCLMIAELVDKLGIGTGHPNRRRGIISLADRIQEYHFQYCPVQDRCQSPDRRPLEWVYRYLHPR